MLRIRHEQMAAFAAHRWERYVDSLWERIAPALPAPDAAQRALLDQALRDAPRHGFTREADIARFGLFALRFGRDPATDAGSVGAVLHDLALAGPAKLDALEAAVD